jgi:hypothetical protein
MGTLALSLLICAPVFGETAPWQQGTVVNVNRGDRGDQLWTVTVNLGNKVLVVRPYVMASGVDAILRSASGQSLKDYVLPEGVSPGISVKVAVFSNGTVTLQNGGGRNYGGEILSQTLAPEQKPVPVYVEPTISPRQTTTADLKTEFPWKQVDDPNQRWKFTIRDQFVFGELAMPLDRQQAGDFFAIDTKKRELAFVGTARLRATIPIGAGLHKTCEWTFAIELTSVTPERIEGKINDEKHQEGCDTLGKGDNWDSAIWVRE